MQRRRIGAVGMAALVAAGLSVAVVVPEGVALAQDQQPNTIIISDDGSSVSNDASGTSNTAIRPEPVPGVTREARAPREERDRGNRNRRNNDAGSGEAAPAAEGEFAPYEEVGAAAPVDTAQAAPEAAAPAEAAATETSAAAPIRLPNTGVGALGGSGFGSVLAALGAAAAVAAVSWRRLRLWVLGGR